MSTRLGLIGVLLALCGVGLFAWAWSSRGEVEPNSEVATPTGSAPVQDSGPSQVELRAPAPDEPPASEPEPAVEVEPEPEEAPAPVPVARPLLDQSATDWMVEYAETPLEDVERDLEALTERIAEESKVAFKTALAEGQFEVVPAGTPAPSAPDDPNGLFVSDRDAGDGNVQRVVLYPHNAPQLYALRSKVQWLERRRAELGGG